MEMAAIVLAGGESLRMGKDKAFIEFKGKSLIQRTLDTLKPLFNDIMIIAKRKEPFSSFGVPVCVDIYPEGGPMGGIYTGLFHSKGPVFAVACDMPFLNPEVIRFLTGKLLRPVDRAIQRPDDFDAIVLKSPDGLHPLHGVYSRPVLPLMKKLLEKREVKMMDFLKRINTLVIGVAEIRHLDPDLACLTNINTPEEMNLIRRVN
jgi:molybdopterin-guanine dinucleotide biosynthesis protein A